MVNAVPGLVYPGLYAALTQPPPARHNHSHSHSHNHGHDRHGVTSPRPQQQQQQRAGLATSAGATEGEWSEGANGPITTSIYEG